MKKEIKNRLLYSAFCAVLLLCSCNQAVKESAAQKSEAQEEVNSAEKLTIVANVTIYPEYKDEILSAIQAVVEGTRREPGNISYDVFEDTANPLRFTFIEHWKSQSAIDAHNASDHFLRFAKAVENKASLEAFILKQKY
ncbi:MAG: antibiotic biosynthesis monooxygenase [Tannerellaceae bacterium]|jgi:quinol monooxygenase YgiN|nr:antibiotic biosynthesis monooxygenase [Tannerellaceae bacterium]